MKTLTLKSLMSFGLLLTPLLAHSQCIKNISTNPNSPVNDEYVDLINTWYEDDIGEVSINSFMNTDFNWYWPNNIFINTQQGWDFHPNLPQNDPSYPMMNPFDEAMPTEFSYLRPNNDSISPFERDFRWEDGWELLWLNLGKYPNGDPVGDPQAGSYAYNLGMSSDQQSPVEYAPNPENVPYFVLYNRYRGLLRVFANVWFDSGSFDDVAVKIRFSGSSGIDNELSGLLRHASGYDQSLSQPTSISQINSPRFHSPNSSQWMVADFQMGYDPCTCWGSGELEIVFIAFNTLEVELQSRSVSLEQPITDSLYTESDFFNISDLSGDYEPGTVIYQNMDNLYTDYENKLNQYNQQMEDHMAWKNNILRQGMDAVSQYVTGGLGGALTPPLTNFVVWAQNRIDLTDASEDEIKDAVGDGLKEGLGKGYDMLSAELYPEPETPRKPTTPTATFEETFIKGTITDADTTKTSGLKIPGTISSDDPTPIGITPFNYPAYNETLGLFALLEEPKLDYKEHQAITHYEDHSHFLDSSNPYLSDPMQMVFEYTEIRTYKDIEFKLAENLLYAINDVVDIDDEKTNYRVYFELEFETPMGKSNLLPPPPSALYMVPPGYEAYNHPVVFQFEENDTIPHNLYLKHVFPSENKHNIILDSDWYDFSEIGDVLFSTQLRTKLTFMSKWEGEHAGPFGVYTDSESNYYENEYFYHRLKKVRMKIMPDFYFDQTGTNGEQINNTQVFTYLIYDSESLGDINEDGEINLFDAENLNILNNVPDTLNEYHPGIITIESDTIGPNHPLVNETNGDTLFIHGESILIDGDIEVENGYFLSIEGVLAIRVIPNSSIGQNIALRINKDHYPLGVMPPPLSSSEIANYCQGNTYSANSPSRSLLEQLEEEAVEEAKKEKYDKAELAARVFPNPSQGQFKTEIDNLSNGKVRLEIFSMSGLRIHSDETTTQSGYLEFTIDLSAQSNGLYILRITDSEGKTVSERIQKL